MDCSNVHRHTASVQATIRPAATEDLAEVMALLEQLAPSWHPEDPKPAVTQGATSIWHKILADERRVLLVADDAGALIGLVDVVVVQTLLDGCVPHAIIDGLVVEKRLRGTGVGRALIGAAHAVAVEVGCCRMELLSSKEQTGAHAFYRTVGFTMAAEGFRADLTER